MNKIDFTVHQGKGFRYFREDLGLSTEQMAKVFMTTEKEIKDLEEKPKLTDEWLDLITETMHIPKNAIRCFMPAIMDKLKENTTIINNNENTFNDESSMNSEGGVNGVNNGGITNEAASLHKVIEMFYDTTKELKDTITALQAQINDLKKK